MSEAETVERPFSTPEYTNIGCINVRVGIWENVNNNWSTDMLGVTEILG